MTYRVELTAGVAKRLERIPRADRRRVLGLIGSLAQDPRPRGCKKLVGRDAWRVRVGSFRVIYEIEDHALVVTVIRAGHRKDVYEN